MKLGSNRLGSFEKGIDFLIHFRGRKFTLDNIKDRYGCSYRQAVRLRDLAASMVTLAPAGFVETPDHASGPYKYLWEIKE